MHLERSQYLSALKKTGKKDIGNGTYPRNFSCLSDESFCSIEYVNLNSI